MHTNIGTTTNYNTSELHKDTSLIIRRTDGHQNVGTVEE